MKKAEEYTFLDYLRAAWHVSPFLPGLGRLPVNKLAVGGAVLLGFVNPGFWFLGAAAELTFLWSMSTNPRFQNLVRNEGQKVVNQDAGARMHELIRTLQPDALKRLEKLNSNLSEVVRLMQLDGGGASEFLLDTKRKTMNQLSLLFLRLLVTRQLIRESLNRTNQSELRSNIQLLEEKLKGQNLSESMQRSLTATIEIQQKRLANLERALNNLEVVDMELQRIENQVQLIREEVALNRTPESITASIDKVSSTLGDAEQFLHQHSEFFSTLGGHDDLLTAEIEIAPPPMPPLKLPE